jgi:hypothetical protein
MRMVAVVLGGGLGQWLGAGMPKQLLTLGAATPSWRNNGVKSTGTL